MRINSNWTRNLNVRLETTKLLEGNTGSKILDNALGNDFLDMTPKVQATEEVTDKGTASKLKASVQQRIQLTE